MIRKEYVIKFESGLHARPASELVEKAQEYDSDISVFYPAEDMEANAKSIISILSLGADKGAQVIIQAEGRDEDYAIEDIIELLDNIMD